MNILNLVLTLLPVGEEIATLFIHNPQSQHTMSGIVSTVNALEPVFAALAQRSAGAPAPVQPVNTSTATPTPAASVVIPAGVPSAHSA